MCFMRKVFILEIRRRLFDLINDSRTRLVIRNRIGFAWKRDRVAQITAASLEGDARARGLFEGTIRITKPIGDSTILTNDRYQA
jgi:hypothetical protein